MKRKIFYLSLCLVLISYFALFEVNLAIAESGPSLENVIFFGGSGDQVGRGIAIREGKIFLSGYGPGYNIDGLVARYSLPLATSPDWFAYWPNQAGPPRSGRPRSNNDYFSSVAVSSEGIYLAGTGDSFVWDRTSWIERKSYLVKFLQSGLPEGGLGGCLWYHSPNFFSYHGEESFRAVLTVEDGSTDIYAAGSGEYHGWGGHRTILAKYNTSGTLLWMRSYGSGSSGGSSASDIVWLDGYLYIVGRNNNNQAMLLKYDVLTTPSPVWSRPIGFAGYFSGVTAFEGAIYAVGYTPGIAGSQDYFIQKYAENGILLWSTTSGGGDTDILTDVVEINGRLFAVGYTKSKGAGEEDAVIMEIDPSNGAIVSETLFGGVQNDKANGIATDGTDLYVVGESRSFSEGGNSVGENDVILLHYSLNVPPIAVCKDIEIPADENCQASITAVDVDGGSYDPDEGDTITLSVDNLGPFTLGEHDVNLTVTDEHDASDICQAMVTVVDETPPYIFISYHDCVQVGKGKGKMANKLTVNASDNCTDEVNLVIDKVEVFNYGGQLVLGKGIYDIIGNDIYVYPNANGRSIKVTVTAIDDSGNPNTQILEKALLKCKK